MQIVKVDIHEDHKKRDEKWSEIAKKLYEARQMKEHFAILELQLMADLKGLSHHTSSKCNDFIFTCTTSKGSIDYKEIPQLYGIDLELYRKPEISRWKLTKI